MRAVARITVFCGAPHPARKKRAKINKLIFLMIYSTTSFTDTVWFFVGTSMLVRTGVPVPIKYI
ncbi:MAG: hypothetical protein A2044_00465 [Candidatus Firestonebacteria bacterium GWA2_43_8]|nr:MAG: hypothetical protein A2044_00465 [Candidatus Firestonebacteria bacterium GWA2_43_8]